jgi:ATP-dependent DNA helicase RecG
MSNHSLRQAAISDNHSVILIADIIELNQASRMSDRPNRLQESVTPPSPRPEPEGGPPEAALMRRFARLDQPVRFLKGVGPKMAERLARKDLTTIEDLLYFLPRRYEDRRNLKPLGQIVAGRRETVVGKVVRSGLTSSGYRHQFEVTLKDDSGTMTVRWIRGRFAYLHGIFRVGVTVILTGDVRSVSSGLEMIHPDFETLDGDDEKDRLPFSRIVPVYSETEGLPQKTIRRIMGGLVASHADDLVSPIPASVCRRQRLMDMPEAVRRAHFPDQDEEMDDLNGMRSAARRRIVFDEFFFFQLGMALRYRENVTEPGCPLDTRGPMLKRFFEALPFRMTPAQERVWSEIAHDLDRSSPMNRLLQGDVGSGKTVVALAALVTACQNGFQAALMAPTEVLAAQHHRTIRRWLQPLGIEAELLTGSLTARERQSVYGGMQRGAIPVAVGTQALIQASVSFHRLGLIVIDEQHRFGVLQRGSLRGKGRHPHVLVMTATPIPRTLAMTLYGDLDVSIIDGLPPGKKPILTRVLTEGQRSSAYRAIRQEVEQGRQVFIVYPLVQESEVLDLKDASRMADHLKAEVFPDCAVGLIHGRMTGTEKGGVMERFSKGEIQILVATSVIEVGIDVPRASLMVIEHAERFGLSQLHQLRGRVGRSEIASACLLMVGKGATLTARRRLRIMAESNDGFRIAEEDLAIRGPGEFMGTRQSGIPDFRVAHLVRDMDILQAAKEEAFRVVSEDPTLTHPRHGALRRVLFRRWEGRLQLARTA